MKLLTVILFNLMLCGNLQAETTTVVIPVEISQGAIEALTPQDAQEVKIEVTEEDMEDSEDVASN